MNTPGRIVSRASVFCTLLLLAPLASRAQMRAAPAAPMVAAHPVFRSIHVSPTPTHVMAVPRARINTPALPPVQRAHAQVFAVPADDFANSFAGGSGETLQELLDPVPGPGFDYAHLAAIDKDLAIKAVIDPETQWRLAVAERVLRATGGFVTPGFYMLDGGGEYMAPAEPAAEEQPQQAQQPEVIVLQQPAQKPGEESAPAIAPPPTAVPDVGNLILVLRNGKKIQAVAFTRTGDRIAYITADGERQSIAAGELDSAATERINEESGAGLTL